ncbi:MAG: sigma-70 family RNA polymerase sigma factor [Labilithrix sp.]|nr:sigma-70 family RNA polymerase sigma factor [Labilithrix sp.]MCW5812383.1 sigma-70 family RNA polymerase sigma factor [Labilithrix sp.]
MSSGAVPDVQLLARIAEGDPNAMAELYDRHVATVFPIALRVLRDRAEAEDVVHDSFVAVSERAAQYVPERGSVIAWLVTLVRNLSIDRTRRRERRGVLAREVIAHEPPPPVPDPEALTADAKERETIRRALARLPDAQRQTLEVAFFEGLSYPEIAAREGVPLGTIKSRAARALAALREALASEGLTVDAAPGAATPITQTTQGAQGAR